MVVVAVDAVALTRASKASCSLCNSAVALAKTCRVASSIVIFFNPDSSLACFLRSAKRFSRASPSSFRFCLAAAKAFRRASASALNCASVFEGVLLGRTVVGMVLVDGPISLPRYEFVAILTGGIVPPVGTPGALADPYPCCGGGGVSPIGGICPEEYCGGGIPDPVTVPGPA